MRLVTRAQWGARPRGSGSTRPFDPRGVCIHWEGAGWTWPWAHSTCDNKVRAIQAYHMDSRGWSDIAYCVDEQTEILTGSGWKRYSELIVGEEVLTLNHETGLSEWQPLGDVYVFPAQPRRMILMEGSEHSSLTTPNHRWAVETYRRRGNRDKRELRFYERRWKTSETLTYFDRIPVAARSADTPTEPKWTDALVEAIAWFWTEGHIQKTHGRPSRNVALYQSTKAATNLARIRGTLAMLFGPPVTAFPRSGSPTDGVPRWREAINGHKVEFFLSADASDLIAVHAPGRVPTAGFIRSLTQAQLELFISVSMLADNNGSRSLAQKNRFAAEAFALACTLSGRAVSFRALKPTPGTPYSMCHVQMMSKAHIYPASARDKKSRFTVTEVEHDGIVWCPRTPNQTWLARRNGKTYFTGNSFLACPHGYVFEGRGLDRRSAANGGTEQNTYWYAVQCMWGSRSGSPGRDLLIAGRDAIDYCRGPGGAGDALRGHRDMQQTDCPGDQLYAWARRGAPRPQPPKDDDMPLTNADVRKILNTSLGIVDQHGRAVTVGSALRTAAWLGRQFQERGHFEEQLDRIEIKASRTLADGPDPLPDDPVPGPEDPTEPTEPTEPEEPDPDLPSEPDDAGPDDNR